MTHNQNLIVVFIIATFSFLLIFASTIKANNQIQKRKKNLKQQQTDVAEIDLPKFSNELEMDEDKLSSISQKTKEVIERYQEQKKNTIETPIIKLKTQEELDRFDKTKLFEVVSCGKRFMLTEKQLFFYDKIKSLQTLHYPAKGKDVATAFTVEKYKHLSVSEFRKLPKWKFKISPHIKTVRGLIKCGLVTREGVDGYRAY